MPEAGVQRWQTRRFEQRFSDRADDGHIWHRGLNAAELGALQCLWPGATWTRARRHQQGFCQSPLGLACNEQLEALGRR
eukprot:2235577-Pyramimonas_sp.AAC.1